MNKTVIIMRGPSGSGKSTFVDKTIKDLDECLGYKEKDVLVCSGDHFFQVPCGLAVSERAFRNREGKLVEYRFNPSKLGEAHAECLSRFIGAVTEQKKKVIFVDNTNIRNWEWKNYAMVARTFGYEIVIHEFRPESLADLKTCIKRNVHQVPMEVVCRMCVDFEPCELAVGHSIANGEIIHRPERTEEK